MTTNRFEETEFLHKLANALSIVDGHFSMMQSAQKCDDVEKSMERAGKAHQALRTAIQVVVERRQALKAEFFVDQMVDSALINESGTSDIQ